MIVRHCSFHRCYRAVMPLPGVQFSFSTANSRAIAVHRLELHEMDGAMRGLLRPKLRWMRGRIGEVPAPASRFESFTPLIRTCGAQRESCSARPTADAAMGGTP
jgi:hypothetical protein